MKHNIVSKFFLKIVCILTITINIYPMMPGLRPGPQMPSAGARGFPGAPGAGGMPQFQISQDEIKALTDYISNLDEKELEELEKLSKQMLEQMGFDPETLAPTNQPAAPTTPLPPIQTPALPTAPEKKEPTPRATDVKEAGLIINALIDSLTSLRQKALLDTHIENILKHGLHDVNQLTEIIYLLKLINKPEHYKRLALPEFQALFKALIRLERALSAHEPSVTITKKEYDIWDDAYTILGVTPTATQQEIDAAYQEHKNRLQKEQEAAEEKPGHKEHIKAAQLSFEFITEAYDTLSDPAARKLIDKERHARLSSHHQNDAELKYALNPINNALTHAIFNEQAITTLEQFLKKYEPQQLEMRKKMEEEEKARARELAELAKREPAGRTVIAGRSAPTYQPGGFHGGYQPFAPYHAPSAYAPSRYQPPVQPTLPTTAPAGGAGHGGGAPSAGTGKKPQAGKGGTLGGLTKPEQEDSKLPEADAKRTGLYGQPGAFGLPTGDLSYQTVAQSINELDKQLFAFNESIDKRFFEDIKSQPQERTAIAHELKQFRSLSKIDKLAEHVLYVHDLINKADKHKQAQYKALWKGIEKNRKKFKQNSTLVKEALGRYKQQEPEPGEELKEELKKGEQPTPPQPDIIGQTIKHLNQLTNTFEKINKLLGTEDQPLFAKRR